MITTKAIPSPPVVEDPVLDRWLRDLPRHIAVVNTYEIAYDPGTISATSEAVKTITVNGLATNDVVLVNKPTKTASLSILDATVTAANTLSLTFRNFSGGGISPGSETYRIVSIRL